MKMLRALLLTLALLSATAHAAVAFRQNISTWGNQTAGPQTSGSFTATASDTILVVNYDGAGSSKVLVYTGSLNTPTSRFLINDTTNGNTVGLGSVLSAVSGSQTLTVNSSPGGDNVSGYAIEYSGVTSATYTGNGPIIGTTAPTGAATLVPTGSILIGLLFMTHVVAGTPAGSASGGVTPTDRQVANTFAISEWVGTGSTVTPTWSAPNTNWAVFTVLLSPTAAVGNANMFLIGKDAANDDHFRLFASARSR